MLEYAKVASAYEAMRNYAIFKLIHVVDGHGSLMQVYANRVCVIACVGGGRLILLLPEETGVMCNHIDHPDFDGGPVMDDTQRDAIELIAAIVQKTGLTPTEIARRAGLAPSTLTRLYPEPSVKTTLSARTLSKLRATFDSELTEEFRETGSVRDDRSVFKGAPTEAIPLYGVKEVAADKDGRPSGTEKLYLYGADLGVPSGTVAAPGQTGVPGRHFAIYMPNETMEPRYRTGEILIVDRVRPPSVGGDVWVEFTPSGEDSLLTLAKLESIDRDQYILRQYRYGDKGTVHRSKILRIFSITGAFES